jgi:hypothetical protein
MEIPQEVQGDTEVAMLRREVEELAQMVAMLMQEVAKGTPQVPQGMPPQGMMG